MIHPTAILEGNINLPDSASIEIGPYAVLRGDITMGPGNRIGPHACLEGVVELGDDNVIGHGAVIGAVPQDLGFQPDTSSGVRIGHGNTVREHVTIHRSSHEGGMTVLGDRNFLMVGCHLGHDVRTGDDNVLANNVLLAGHVSIGHHVFLGGGSVFHQFIRVGDYAIAQGNAGISQDLPPYVIAHGINLIAGLNVVGLRRAGVTNHRRAQLKQAFDLVYLARLPMTEILHMADDPSWTDESCNFLGFFRNPSRKGVCR